MAAQERDLAFLPKLLLQHDSSPDAVLEDVRGAFLDAVRQRAVQACASPSGDGLAVALGQRLVVLRALGGGSSSGAPHIEFVSAVDAPETVTALCWLAAGGQSADECLVLGTSAGFLQLHCATSGALLLRQPLHHTGAVAAAVRRSGCGTDPEDLSQDVTLTFADAVVRLPAWEVWAAVRWHAGQGGGARGGHWWSAGGGAPASAAPHQAAFSKFLLPRGTGPRSAALCLGPPPPSLYAALAGRAESPHRQRILTAGAAPPLASFEAEEAAAPGLLSLVSDLASSTAASLLGTARSYVPNPAASVRRSLLGGLRRSRGGGGSAASVASSAGGSTADLQAAGQGRAARQERIPGEPAKPQAAVWDEKRSVSQMALSPCGRWAACCDSLGRVLLVDAPATLAVRMLKGYREAQVAWLVCGPQNSSSGGGGGGWPLRTGSSSSLAGSSAPPSARSSVADLAALCSPERRQGAPPEQTEGSGANEHTQQDWQAAAGRSSPEQHAAAGRDSPGGGAGPEAQQPRAQQQPGEPAVPRRPGDALLAIYAPRRAVVELWEPHSSTRVGSVRCSTQLGLLLEQPAARRPAGAASGSGSAAPSPNKCWLLDAATLLLHDLTPELNALVE